MPTAAEDGPLTREERRLRGLLYLNAAIALAFVAIYIAGAVGTASRSASSSTRSPRTGCSPLLSLLGAAHVRRNGWLALVVAFGYVVPDRSPRR